jgi:phytoene dehydrogenase-like protein
MMADPDFVIVGSGLAALAFGALMAKAGRRVTVLEAHDKPGGYGHSFDIGPYRFNAQLHYVWNVGEGRTVGRFLDKLGLTAEVPFVKLDPNGYDHMRIPGYALDIPCSFGDLAARLGALFPAHAARLADFVEEVRLTDAALEALPSSLADLPGALRARGWTRLVRYRHATLGDVFDRFQLPLEARALIALQWPDFLLPPGQLSFFAWVKLFAGYARGAYYPTRHFHDAVDALVRVITSNGGTFQPQRKVTRFLLEGGQMRGVRVEHVDDRGVGQGVFEDVLGKAVICNMDPRQAAEMIGFDSFAPPVRKRLAYEYSPSSFVAYCAVEGIDLREHGFGAWNVFHADGPDLDAIFAAMYERGDYTKLSFAMSTPNLVSDAPGIAPPGHQILELLTVAQHARFLESKLDDPRAYNRQKQRILDAMLDVIERDYVPGIRAHLKVHVTGSPTTSERYARAPAGNSYGATMTPARIWPGRLDHRTSIDRFWFCNASSGFAGFAGTIWTGSRLYERLTGDRFLR